MGGSQATLLHDAVYCDGTHNATSAPLGDPFCATLVPCRYVQCADKIFCSAGPELQSDFPTQMAKLGLALSSDRYAVEMALKEEVSLSG